MREIVTIQVGEFANYIGSHFWNFQDELLGLSEESQGDPIYSSPSLDMGVLYRTGETQQGIPMYNPRLVSIGLQGSLGSLSSSSSLYNESSSCGMPNIQTWTGNVSRHISEPHKKNLFLQSLYEEQEKFSALDDNSNKESSRLLRQVEDKDRVESLENNVRFWTDFSKANFHPRSLYQLHGSWADGHTFNNYGIGKDVFSEGQQGEEMNERLRFFVEECDHIQGFQFIIDDSGGFSSVAADFLENIADEYSNTPVLLYSVRDPSSYAYGKSKKDSIARALHDAVSFSRLSSFCKLMIPVGLPSLSRSKLSSYLHVDDQKLFHSSVIYAASIHTITIPFRMQLVGPTANSEDISGAVGVGGVTQILTGQARQNVMATLGASMPAPSLSGGSILRAFQSLTPEIEENIDDSTAVESLIIQGALHSGSHRASIAQVKDSIAAAYESDPPLWKPMFSHLSVALCPLPIPLSFPSIFGNQVGRHGELSAEAGPQSRRGPLETDSIPMAARLQSSKAIVPFIEKRLGSLQSYGAPGAELLRTWGFGKDDLEDMREELAGMARALNPCSQPSSDSDFD